MATLFELKNEHEHLLAQAIDLETGEVRDEEALVLFEKNEIDLQQKVVAYGVVIKTLEAQATAIESVIHPLEQRHVRLISQAEYLRERLRELGECKVVDPRATVTVREGKPIAQVVNESVIPRRFFKATLTLQKTPLFEALQLGKKIRGAVLGRGRRVLTIK